MTKTVIILSREYGNQQLFGARTNGLNPILRKDAKPQRKVKNLKPINGIDETNFFCLNFIHGDTPFPLGITNLAGWLNSKNKGMASFQERYRALLSVIAASFARGNRYRFRLLGEGRMTLLSNFGFLRYD
jgi:hypothetical protein